MGGIEGPTVESQAVGNFARVMRPGARLVVVLLFLGLVAVAVHYADFMIGDR